MKSFICGQIRVLFVEGEPCNYIIVDIYSPNCIDLMELVNTEEVTLGKEERNLVEIQCIEVGNGNGESILAKICTQKEVNSETEALAILRKVYERLGLTLEDDITCALEA